MSLNFANNKYYKIMVLNSLFSVLYFSKTYFVSASIIFIHVFNFYSQVFYLPID